MIIQDYLRKIKVNDLSEMTRSERQLATILILANPCKNARISIDENIILEGMLANFYVNSYEKEREFKSALEACIEPIIEIEIEKLRG